MSVFYTDLAPYWPLISSPEDYADEAAFFLTLFAPVTARAGATLLELGSGGGNNAVHMKTAFAATTLSDLSAEMLAVSRALNPDCDHHPGDLRTIRLGRTFDAVFIHDAIDYMTTLADLRAAFATAFIHCAPGGIAVIVPDHVAETFEPSTDYGGNEEDEEAATRIRFLEWTHAPIPGAATYITDYVFAIKEGDQPTRVIHDQHQLGLFPRVDWLRLLAEVGFAAQIVIDPYGREVFVARRDPHP